MERMEFDLLFRWFVGLGVDEPVWDASVFSKNSDRLLAGEVAQRFLAELLALPAVKRLLSAEHFSVDGTLLQALASLKSFRRKDGEDEPPGPGALVGKRGRTASPLRPGGKAEIDGEYLDVFSDGGFIDPGTPVEVVRREGNRVIVREVG